LVWPIDGIGAGIKPAPFSRTLNTPAATPSGVSLREVRLSDLPNFFEDQRDPAGARMAGFTPRDHAAFMAHWHKIMANPACAIRTILFNGSIAGYMCAWTDGTDRCVGYWIGREFWGRGVASAALVQFLHYETTRPLTARVVKHNAASIRVLQKAGFKPAGEEAFELPGGAKFEELVFRL
jgi:RimJ/RimL family protein N-acetyltransferase